MKKISKYLLLLLLCLGLVGCSKTDLVTRKVAEETALTKVDGDVSNYTEKFDDDEPHHLFDIVKDGKHYEVKVHRETGKIISSEEMDDNESIQRTVNGTTSATDSFITEDEAKEIALEKVGGGTVIKTKLTTDHGDKIYKVEIQYNNKECEVTIDAVSKEILDYEEEVID